MGYKNLATRTLPGLIVLIVDHSEGNNQNVDNADRLVNSIIAEWGLVLSMTDDEGNELVIDDLYICCIIHESRKAIILKEGPISSFIDSPIAVEENVKDEFGAIWNRPIYIPSISNGEPNLAAAFKLAKQRILEWKFAHVKDIGSISTPLVINFLCQPIPDFDVNKVEIAANSMKDVPFPDGRPILLNILLGNWYENCFFPVHERDIGVIDRESLLLYRISSLFDSELRAINEERILGAFSYWREGREIDAEARLMIGGDNKSIFLSLIEFPLWFHLRGLE